MNLVFFISRRMGQESGRMLTGSFVRIATISVALGLSVMIISVSILTGFQQKIREKVTGFSAHIQIDKFDEKASFESSPVSTNQDFYPELNSREGIDHIQVFAYKAGIIKTDNQIQGIVLKGVGSDFKWNYFADFIIEGKIFNVDDTVTSNSVIISKFLSDKLDLNTGDDVRVYFVSGESSQVRGRKLEITGIYETELEEFDKLYILGDIKHVQKLNDWQQDQVSGFEVFIRDFKDLDKLTDKIYQEIGYDLNVKNIRMMYPQIFDWLGLLDQNVVVILVLMLFVSGITMISTLLIIILERTTMIGILKSLGLTNRSLQKVFLYYAASITLKGLIWGNMIGLTFIILEQQFHFLPLDERSYYIDYVPVLLNPWHVILINAGAFILNIMMMAVPSYIITKMTPVRALRVN